MSDQITKSSLSVYCGDSRVGPKHKIKQSQNNFGSAIDPLIIRAIEIHLVVID